MRRSQRHTSLIINFHDGGFMKATPLRVIIVLTFFVVLAAALHPLAGRAHAQEGGERRDSRQLSTTDDGSQGVQRKLSRKQRGQADFSPNVTCTFMLSPTSQAFGPAGGSNSFNVTVGNTCNWTAMTNDGWITINSGAGIGNGTVNYTIAQNISVTPRTGTITVGDQTFTVT